MEGEHIMEPLMYIDQPVFERPKAHMQMHYLSSREVKETEKRTENVEQSESTFRNLTIKEKINYLVNLPSEVPKIRCEIVTDKKIYRGKIIKQHNEEIELRIIGRDNKLINIDEIINIRLIGF